MSGQTKGKDLRLTMGPVHERNIQAVKKICAVTLPAQYSDQFWKDLIATESEFTRAVVLDGALVATCGCIVQPRDDGKKRLYIAVLAVLAAYRGIGLGTRMVQHLLEKVQDVPDIAELSLHVQDGNEDAMEFYTKMGFEKAEAVEDYYSNLTPAKAYIFRRSVNDAAPAAAGGEA